MKNNFIIKKHEEFNNIINNGNRIKGKVITIYYHQSENNKKYFGFAVGKKNGNAVTRNFIKRRLRMLVSSHQNIFSNNYKYIIMVGKDSLKFSYDLWEQDLLQIIGKVE